MCNIPSTIPILFKWWKWKETNRKIGMVVICHGICGANGEASGEGSHVNIYIEPSMALCIVCIQTVWWPPWPMVGGREYVGICGGSDLWLNNNKCLHLTVYPTWALWCSNPIYWWHSLRLENEAGDGDVGRGTCGRHQAHVLWQGFGLCLTNMCSKCVEGRGK